MISLAAYRDLLRESRNFRLLWLAQIVSEIGDWFYSLALYSLILELTGRAELVAYAVVVQVLPQTLVSPTAGVVNDRLSRKQVMIAADVARVFIVAMMLLVRTREMIWLVYPLLFLETIGWAFFEPGRSAVIPNVVPQDRVLVANTLSSTTWSFNLAVGATLGGAVAALLGRDAVFLLNSLSFAVSALLIRLMRFEEPHVRDASPLRWRDLADFTPVLEGIRYVRSDQRLLPTVLVKGGLGLLGSNLVILPVLGERVFPTQLPGVPPDRAGVMAMSLLMGVRGIGALLGPFVSGPWAGSDDRRLRLGILWGFIAAAAGYMLLSQSPFLAFACAAVVMSHAGGSTIWVFSTTLLQMYTEDRFRGRVFAAELGLNMASISAASYVAGRLIDSGVEPRNAALVTGCLLVIPALLWLTTLRRQVK
jgi:MFS family permease